MGWVISMAIMRDYESLHCSLEQGGGYSVGTCSDGVRSALSSGNPTPQAFLSSDKMTEFSRLSRFGMTFKPLTEGLGEDVLTWFLAASRARTLAPQDAEPELTGIAQECGDTWRGWLAKYDQHLCGWRTAQCSLIEGSEECLETFPRWGMTRNGLLWEHPALEPIMNATESGSLLPTPTCHNAKEGAYPAEFTRNTPTLGARVGGKIHPEFTEWMMGWPQGWTDLRPLEMDKFQSAWLKRGNF
jgi:hypothetical protein